MSWPGARVGVPMSARKMYANQALGVGTTLHDGALFSIDEQVEIDPAWATLHRPCSAISPASLQTHCQ